MSARESRLLSVEKLTPEHFETTVPIKEFSNLSIDPVYDLTTSHFQFILSEWKLNICSNGYNNETEGYLSMVFYFKYIRPLAVRANVAFIISVIDVEGNKKFPRSFVSRESNDLKSCFDHVSIDNYISRRALFNDASTLLPTDTLSLHIHLDILVEPHFETDRRILESDIYEDDDDMEMCYLRMDSKLWKILCEESSYFQRLTSPPMIEKRGIYKIPLEDRKAFLAIERIFRSRLFYFNAFQDVCDVYKTAKMYDIQVVVDLCRRCLELSLTPWNSTDIIEFARAFSDDRLSEAAEAFPASDGEGRNKFVWKVVVVQSRMACVKYEWIFMLMSCESDDYFLLELHNEKKYVFEERDEYDFYS